MFSLGHIISGACILSVYARKAQKYWSKVTPDITLTHDEKKGYNEGYGMSVGMRIKI